MKARFPRYTYPEYEEGQNTYNEVRQSSEAEGLFVENDEVSPGESYFNGGGAYTEAEFVSDEVAIEDAFVPTETYQLDYSKAQSIRDNKDSAAAHSNSTPFEKAGSEEKRINSDEGLSLIEAERNEKLNQLELLKEAMVRDAKIPYKDESQFVFNDGCLDSPVMFFGEAPGEEEVLQGKPFVGKSGKLLQKMLDAAGITRDRMYITNAVVWRPPLNRTPLPAEIEEMAPYAIRHIEIMKPKILVLIGGVSYRCIMREAIAISKIRGIWQSRYFCPAIINIFHPSYLIRAQIHKRETWFDILSVRERVLETGWKLGDGVLRPAKGG